MEEDPDFAARHAGTDFERPYETQWPAWAWHIKQAWQELGDERFFGAMGGIGRIYFSAIDRYAERFGIVGEQFEQFLFYLRALDTEYIEHMNTQAKARADGNH